MQYTIFSVLRASKDLNPILILKKMYKTNLEKEGRSRALKMNFGQSILRKIKIRAKIKDVRSKVFFKWYGRRKKI